MISPNQAAIRILSLVSGFPGDRARFRGLLMLQAYVDASGKGDPEFLVIAGYIATPEVWAEFSKAWKSQLDEAKMPYFKMNELRSKPEFAGWFYRLIEEYEIKAAISCVINTRELVEVERSIKYPSYIINTEEIQNPYYFGFKAITDVLAQQQHRIGLTEPVDFIFDNEGEKVRIPRAWEMMKAASRPDIAKMMGDTPIYRDDKVTMPLQAADLYAWWILYWERQQIAEWARDLPFPWGTKKNIPRLAMSFGRRDFLIEASLALAKYARTPEDLKYFQSLHPDAGA